MYTDVEILTTKYTDFGIIKNDTFYIFSDRVHLVKKFPSFTLWSNDRSVAINKDILSGCCKIFDPYEPLDTAVDYSFESDK